MNYSKKLKISSVFLMAMVILLSCRKDRDVLEEEPTNYYKLRRAENLAPAEVGAKTLYFNLDSKSEVSAASEKTAGWDLAFGGSFVSYMSGNYGADAANYGAGNNTLGGVLIIQKSFDEVIDIPDDSEFKTGKNVYGMDGEGDRAAGALGWYLYDMNGTIRGDGSARKKHVVYAMPEKRTVIVRTAKGDYAKIKMISCYKDALTADKWFSDVPFMFYTFEYVVVPKGSTKFEVK